MLLDLLLIVIGIALLVKGSDILVDSASNFALKAGVPAVVIGLSLVALGTSLPELVIGVNSSLAGLGDIALGNVIGSNIVNICLVIGLGALIRDIRANTITVRTDVPLTIATVVLLVFLSIDGKIGFRDGIIMLAAAAIYFYYVYWRAKKEGVPGIEKTVPVSNVKEIIMVAIGIIMSYVGGVLTVDSTTSIAAGIGISPYLISVTVIALGTNLPEIATTIIASLKDKGDLILGNGLGSINVNILVVIGICAIINPIKVADRLDIIISLILCILLLLLLYIDRRFLKKRALYCCFYMGSIYRTKSQLK